MVLNTYEMPTRGKIKFDVKSAEKYLQSVSSKRREVFTSIVKEAGEDFIKRVKERMPYKRGVLYERGLQTEFNGEKFSAKIRAMQSDRQEILYKRRVGAVPPPFKFQNNPLGSDWEFGSLVDDGGATIPMDREHPITGQYQYPDTKAPNAQGFFSDTVNKVKRDWSDERRLKANRDYSDWLD